MTKNGKQQILEAAIRVMSEVGITPPRKDSEMSKDFSQMTAAELREYAETVQAEYDADELSGPSGRQIVRDAWQRVAEAERAEAEAVYTAPDAPRDTTPMSAEAWEAMHGIGQEPIADERPIMMIRRRIVEDTAGYYGYTKYDSVRVWRLYATQNGDIWGAQWTHFRMANGNVVDWQESTWGTMQHVRQFIEASAELNDVLTEWERY